MTLADYVAGLARAPGPDGAAPPPPGVEVVRDPHLAALVLTVTGPGVTAEPLAEVLGPGTPAEAVPAGPDATATAYPPGPPAAVVAYAVPGGLAAVVVAWPGTPPPYGEVTLDRDTGRLTMFGHAIGRGTHRLAAAAALGGRWQDMGTGWAWQFLSQPLPDGGRWSISLGHHEPRLARVTLSRHTADEPRGWAGWTREREERKAVEMDAWLDAQVGRERTFRWGETWAGFDGKGGFGSAGLVYEAVDQ
jgi:hypothetical protein